METGDKEINKQCASVMNENNRIGNNVLDGVI